MEYTDLLVVDELHENTITLALQQGVANVTSFGRARIETLWAIVDANQPV